MCNKRYGVWNAAAKTTLDLLDRVQNRAIRLTSDSGITNKLDLLKHCQDVADLTIFYKYSYSHCSKEVSEIMPGEKRVRETRAGTTTHGRAVTLSTVRTSKFQNDFFTRTAKKWNTLPACAFSKQFNIQSFKTNVHKYLISHPIN